MKHLPDHRQQQLKEEHPKEKKKHYHHHHNHQELYKLSESDSPNLLNSPYYSIKNPPFPFSLLSTKNKEKKNIIKPQIYILQKDQRLVIKQSRFGVGKWNCVVYREEKKGSWRNWTWVFNFIQTKVNKRDFGLYCDISAFLSI